MTDPKKEELSRRLMAAAIDLDEAPSTSARNEARGRYLMLTAEMYGHEVLVEQAERVIAALAQIQADVVRAQEASSAALNLATNGHPSDEVGRDLLFLTLDLEGIEEAIEDVMWSLDPSIEVEEVDA